MRIKFIYPALIVLTAMAAFQACKKSGTSPNSGNTGFDRVGMLKNLSTNIIIPGYVSFQASVVSLDSSITAFNTSPDITKLGNLQTTFKIAYEKWQAVSTFDFGPASNENLRISLNTFPADVTQINANVSSGSYNLASLSSLPSEGFPAIDYLLFGTGADIMPSSYNILLIVRRPIARLIWLRLVLSSKQKSPMLYQPGKRPTRLFS
jgi:predicted lipoprotein